MNKGYGLIPFSSGLGCSTERRPNGWNVRGLNPFFFRARLQHQILGQSDKTRNLNPFFFRARLQHPIPRFERRGDDLIPFSSGLGCSTCGHRKVGFG